MKLTSYLFILICSVTIAGCYYDKEEVLYGSAPCDTSAVKYSTTILNILNSNACLSCHGNGTISGGINLEGYSNVKIRATDGSLYGAINHSAGFKPMPQNAAKLSQCDINKVKAWIDAGAANN